MKEDESERCEAQHIHSNIGGRSKVTPCDLTGSDCIHAYAIVAKYVVTLGGWLLWCMTCGLSGASGKEMLMEPSCLPVCTVDSCESSRRVLGCCLAAKTLNPCPRNAQQLRPSCPFGGLTPQGIYLALSGGGSQGGIAFLGELQSQGGSDQCTYEPALLYPGVIAPEQVPACVKLYFPICNPGL
eukprot:552369-Pelagomonas_calceolata.AAC.8